MNNTNNTQNGQEASTPNYDGLVAPGPTIQLDPSEIKRFTTPHISRKDLETILGFRPKKLDIYRQSFVHKSILRIVKMLPETEVPSYMFESNERLEFVGDAILSTVTAVYLYRKFPDKDEGFLTKTRSKLVDTKALSNYARKKNLGAHMLMSRHLIQMNGKDKDKMLENVMEALIGAIYLDLGLDHATKFVHNLFDNLTEWENVLQDTNFKDQILRFCQLKGVDLPVYEIIKTEGPPHERTFEMKVLVGGRIVGTGCGKKKTSAEQQAAQEGMAFLNKNGFN